MNSTINDLKEILNENDYPNVKFSLIAHKNGKDIVFKYELNQPDMWFYIYPTLISAKLNDWSQELSFVESEVIYDMIKK
tara:strand:- start:1179 stop:1415 length:237 start_codon:yes stop_codon:yes gene_type:complete